GRIDPCCIRVPSIIGFSAVCRKTPKLLLWIWIINRVPRHRVHDIAWPIEAAGFLYQPRYGAATWPIRKSVNPTNQDAACSAVRLDVAGPFCEPKRSAIPLMIASKYVAGNSFSVRVARVANLIGSSLVRDS